MTNNVDFIPELLFGVFSMVCLLLVSGFRYKFRPSIIITVFVTTLIMATNILLVILTILII